MTRQITPAVRSDIESWEGCPLFAYDDAVSPPRPAKPGDKIRGTLTIGAGHTGADVYVGQRITQAQADVLLDADLAHSEANVARVVTVPLNADQFGALVSFDFNVGDGALDGSTLLKKLNAGDYAAVPAELAKWTHTHINGALVNSPGLVTRRANEAALWSHGMSTSSQGAVAVKKPSSPTPEIATGAVVGAAIGGASAVGLGVPLPYLAAAAVLALVVIVFIVLRRK